MRGKGVMFLINFERNRCNLLEMLPLDDRLSGTGMDFAVLFGGV